MIFHLIQDLSHDEKITILLESNECYTNSLIGYFLVRFANHHLMYRENHMQAEYWMLFWILHYKLKQEQCYKEITFWDLCGR